jgi:hypothetical protein
LQARIIGSGSGLAALHVLGADQQRRALGQAQALHDRLGETHRLVGDHAPQQVAALDVGQQLGHAVEQLAVHRAVALVALEELLAQGFEAVGVGSMEKVTATIARAPPEISSRMRASSIGRQAAIGEHRLADRDEVRRGVQQGAVHVEENCSQAHAHSSRRVWIM